MIPEAELYKMFGNPLPLAVIQIMQDASEDRTMEDVVAELRSFYWQIEAANHV